MYAIKCVYSVVGNCKLCVVPVVAIGLNNQDEIIHIYCWDRGEDLKVFLFCFDIIALFHASHSRHSTPTTTLLFPVVVLLKCQLCCGQPLEGHSIVP